MKQESIEEIAERIARHHLDSERVSVTQFCDITAAIVEALRARDERAAKIAETDAGTRCMRHQKTGKGVCGYEISKVIREGR